MKTKFQQVSLRKTKNCKTDFFYSVASSSKCIEGSSHYLGNKQDFDVSSKGFSSGISSSFARHVDKPGDAVILIRNVYYRITFMQDNMTRLFNWEHKVLFVYFRGNFYNL